MRTFVAVTTILLNSISDHENGTTSRFVFEKKEAHDCRLVKYIFVLGDDLY